MDKILVPIDFSKCSQEAFLYAKEIANVLQTSLKVVNVYQSPVSVNNKVLLESGKGKDETLDRRLQTFVDGISKQESKANTLTKIKIETDAILGLNVTNTLVKMTQDPEVMMVVMGTQGKHNVVQNVLGSISSTVAQKAHCPVVLVPKGASFKGLNNILYASNYESTDETMLQQIIDFTRLFQAATHFVHIEEEDNYELVKATVFEKLFETGDPSFSFNLINIKDRPVMDALYEYASDNQIDLMVLVNRQRKLMQNVFKMSLTQKMALNPKFPLMVFHLMND